LNKVVLPKEVNHDSLQGLKLQVDALTAGNQEMLCALTALGDLKRLYLPLDRMQNAARGLEDDFRAVRQALAMRQRARKNEEVIARPIVAPPEPPLTQKPDAQTSPDQSARDKTVKIAATPLVSKRATNGKKYAVPATVETVRPIISAVPVYKTIQPEPQIAHSTGLPLPSRAEREKKASQISLGVDLSKLNLGVDPDLRKRGGRKSIKATVTNTADSLPAASTNAIPGIIHPKAIMAEPDFKNELVAEMRNLRAFAISMSGSVDRAEDLVQESLKRAMVNREKFEMGTSVRAWLFTILRNIYYSEYRKRVREVADSDGLYASRIAVPGNQEDHMAIKDLGLVLSGMSREKRDMASAAAVGLTYEESAWVANVPIGTIKSRLGRLRAELEEKLDEQQSPSCPLTTPEKKHAWQMAAGEALRGLRQAAGLTERDFLEGCKPETLRPAYPRLENIAAAPHMMSPPIPMWEAAIKWAVKKTDAKRQHPAFYEKLANLVLELKPKPV